MLTLETSLIHLLHRASQALDRAADGRLAACHLTPRQALALIALASHGPCRQATLVEATGIDRSTLAELLSRLQGKGFVSRVRSRKDSREQIASLTPAGHRALEAGRSALAGAELEALAQLDETAIRHARAALEALASRSVLAKSVLTAPSGLSHPAG